MLVSRVKNKELYNRIETKLSHLNQIGLNLKKENNGLLNLVFIFLVFYYIPCPSINTNTKGKQRKQQR